MHKHSQQVIQETWLLEPEDAHNVLSNQPRVGFPAQQVQAGNPKRSHTYKNDAV